MKYICTALSALVLFASFAVQAEEGGAKTSYSKKKQGMVHFVEEQAVSDVESPASVSADTAASIESADPAAIEPSAGVAEEEAAEEESKVADMIKLPRK